MFFSVSFALILNCMFLLFYLSFFNMVGFLFTIYVYV